MKLIKLSPEHFIIIDESEITNTVCLRYVDNIPYIMRFDKGIEVKQFNILASTKEIIVIHNFDGVLEKYDKTKERILFYFHISILEIKKLIGEADAECGYNQSKTEWEVEFNEQGKFKLK